MAKDEFNEELEYEKSFYPIMIWEKLCFIVLIIFFAVGIGVTFKNRVDKTPPETLTLENYQDFLTVSTSIGNIQRQSRFL